MSEVNEEQAKEILEDFFEKNDIDDPENWDLIDADFVAFKEGDSTFSLIHVDTCHEIGKYIVDETRRTVQLDKKCLVVRQRKKFSIDPESVNFIAYFDDDMIQIDPTAIAEILQGKYEGYEIDIVKLDKVGPKRIEVYRCALSGKVTVNKDDFTMVTIHNEKNPLDGSNKFLALKEEAARYADKG